MSEPMPTIPTQSPFTYPIPNSSASPSVTQDDTFMPNPSASPSFTQDDTFMPEPIQPMPTFTQTAFSQPAVHTQHTHPAQTNPTGQQYPNNVQSQQFQQFQTATISANNAKFPYLEKEKYEIWAMKMEYWIQNADHNLWRIVQQGNSPKRLGKDAKGNTIVHPPVSLDEHVAVQRENKVRTLLLQALPEDHMPDFHHYDDARDIWMAVKARFGFIHVFLDKQLEGMLTHNRIYIAPSHTKKIFGNMRRVGKGFSGRETPLFRTMVVQDQAEIDEAVYKELDDSLVRAATTASSLEVEHDSGGGPRRQETIGDIITQTRFENVSKHSNDPLLARGHTLRSGEDSLKLNELMELCTNLQTRVLNLEKTKTTQAEKIVSLKRRVKKLEQKKRSRTHGLKRLYKVSLTARVESSRDEESLGEDASKQGRINAIDADKDITMVNDQDDADMFDVNTLTELAALKSVKPKVKANVIEEPSVPVSTTSTKVSATTTTTTAIIPTTRKGIVITELAIRLLAEFDEEERLTREKDEANVALIEEWDDIQAKADVDYLLAQRLQAEEQEQFTTKQKATLFKELLE
ncbi:hypothetical protein Tco_1507135 [Tanacetum coccineum]